MPTRRTSIDGLRILVVEDEGLIAEEVCDRLSQAGAQIVATADTGRGAIDAALALKPDVILMDIRLKDDIDGIQAAARITREFAVPIVYLTAHSDQTTLQRAKATSAFGYVLKPFHSKNLLVAIEVAVDRFETERRLEEKQLTYATILTSITDAVIATDTEGCVQLLNPAAERLTGWSNREAQGELAGTVLRFAGDEQDASAEHLVTRTLVSRRPAILGADAIVIGRHGSRFAVDGGISCVVDGIGRVVGAAIAFRDVTAARRAEAERRAIAEQLRATVDTAVDGVLLLEASGKVVMFNPACERLFGYAAADVLGRHVELLIPSPLPAPGEGPTLLPSAVDEGPRVRATTGQRRDRTTFPAEVSIGQAILPDQPPLFVVVVHDVSLRRQLEAAVLEAVGREQRRFGSELHDGLGNDLTGLSLLLAALSHAGKSQQSPYTADLERAHEVARHALQSCESIARGISPIGETRGGLIFALRDLVTRLNAPMGPRVNLSVSEVARLGLSTAATDHLYRIAQEALANALKHSDASNIRISVDVQPARVRLEICDDGGGLRRLGTGDEGLGLRSMQYRASMIGASFEVESLDSNGMCIVCDCPQAA